jgi:cytochrome c oxidase cbb3-type subunit 3
MLMRVKIKIITVALASMLLFASNPVWAAGPPAPSIWSSALAISLISLMGVLLIVIGILANMLIGAADIRLKKRLEEKKSISLPTTILLPIFLLLGSAAMAQGTETTVPVVTTIGDLSAGTFYTMITIVFLELLVIVVLLLNIRSLLKNEQVQIVTKDMTAEQVIALKRAKVSWWDRFNKLKPVSQEGELDLGHDYDGIRELNNKLPPWWLYGFYITIIFAVVYLWRFHISHTGPSSKEEYELSVSRAQARIDAYVKAKGEAVDENTVTRLTATADLDAGKAIFLKSCATCHKPTGAGDVGPNLTDDYWLHGNDIRDLFKTIRYGFNAMPQWQMAYSNKQIAQVASYVKTLHGSNPAGGKAPQGTLMAEGAAAALKDSTKTDTLKTAVIKPATTK